MSNFIQSAYAFGNGGSSSTGTASLSNVTPGNSIVVVLNAPNMSGTVGVSDTKLQVAAQNVSSNGLSVWYLNNAAGGTYSVHATASSYFNTSYLAVFEVAPLAAAPVLAKNSAALSPTGTAGEALSATIPAQTVDSIAFALLAQNSPAHSNGSLALPQEWVIDDVVANAATTYLFMGMAHGEFAVGAQIDATWTATIDGGTANSCDVLTVALELQAASPAEPTLIIQNAHQSVKSSTNINVTLNNVKAGNTLALIAVGQWANGNESYSNPSDSAGQTWSPAVISIPTSSYGSLSLQAWVLTNAKAGTHTLSGYNGQYIYGDAYLLELPPATAVDVVSGHDLTNNTSATVTETVTTTAQTDFALSFFQYKDGYGTTAVNPTNPPVGWIHEFSTTGGSPYVMASQSVVPGNSTISATWNFTNGGYSTSIATAILTFKNASQTPTPTRLAAWTSETYSGASGGYATSMVSPAHDVSKGALLVVMWQDAGGGTGYTLSDTAGNTWSTPQKLTVSGGYGDSYLSYCLSSNAQIGNLITVKCGNGAYLSAFEGAAYSNDAGTWTVDGTPDLFATAYATAFSKSVTTSGPGVIVLGASEYYAGAAQFTETGLAVQSTTPAGATVGNSSILSDLITTTAQTGLTVSLADNNGGYGGRINGALVAFRLNTPSTPNPLVSSFTASSTLSAGITVSSAVASNALVSALTASGSASSSLVIGHGLSTSMQANASVASPITKAVSLGTTLVAEATISSIEPTIAKPLASSSDAVTTMLATATVDRALSGAMLAVSTIQAIVSLGKDLVSASSSSSVLAATFVVGNSLANALADSSSISASVSVDKALRQSLVTASSLSANLFAASSGATALRASSSLTAALSVGHNFQSSSSATSIVSASLGLGKALASALAGQAAIADDLGVDHLLQSGLNEQATVVAALSVGHSLVTRLSTSSNLSSSVLVAKPIVAALNVTSTAVSALTYARPLQTSLTAATSLRANESSGNTLNTALNVSSSAVANLTIGHALSASVSDGSELAANLTKAVSLQTTLSISARLQSSAASINDLSSALAASSALVSAATLAVQLKTSIGGSSQVLATLHSDASLVSYLQSESSLTANESQLVFVALQTYLRTGSRILASAQLTTPASLPVKQVLIYQPGVRVGASLNTPNRFAILPPKIRTLAS